ncbi:hypothetical protein [Parvimonas parva]|uniref:Uncharacterized protein n=1 Tax=Parvimonas parva TaxID=2769485 RepID=A0ABS1C8L7_9FIRM|nr:hypothetical protein [Parvimonas parva]MBK1468447.1 hypothetical protein [Parvimonas parva]
MQKIKIDKSKLPKDLENLLFRKLYLYTFKNCRYVFHLKDIPKRFERDIKGYYTKSPHLANFYVEIGRVMEYFYPKNYSEIESEKEFLDRFLADMKILDDKVTDIKEGKYGVKDIGFTREDYDKYKFGMEATSNINEYLKKFDEENRLKREGRDDIVVI